MPRIITNVGWQGAFLASDHWSRQGEIIYLNISKVMSLLYFGLDVFRLFEARAQELEVVYTCIVVPVFPGKRLLT
jgi:hypothetical protein